jgi:uncharacterized protein YukE
VSFEGHRLNDMIDLVEQANPADLESAGEALKNARDAIAAAAKELGEYIDRADWRGESADAFRKWGKNLVKDTHRLSDFADTASVQIASAGAGLASVRSSMPPRDQRADPKMVEDIPTPKRVEGNAEYDAAAKAENHRQEAINQMNRLSSFYQVSQHSMAGQEPPTFSTMPNVGVPRPAPSDGIKLDGEQEVGPLAPAGVDSQAVPRRPADAAAVDTVRSDDSPPSRIGEPPPIKPSDSMVFPEQPVGTEIDSVATLPPQTVMPAPGSSPPGPSPTGIGGEFVPPFGGGPRTSPIGGPVARTQLPAGGSKTSLPSQGRTSMGPGGPTAGPGRGTSGPFGRTGPTAQGRAVSGSSTGQPPMGRAVTGGTPRPSDATGPRPGIPGTGAGRANGVVGGRPAPGPVPGSASSRLPRGPVIGTEDTGGSRGPSGGASQRGVVGATPQGTSNAGQLPRRSASNADGVVGTPKRRMPARGRGDGFSPGGAGLVRGPVGDGRRPDQVEGEDAQRSGRLVEDEEIHLPSNRRHVPPVID